LVGLGRGFSISALLAREMGQKTQAILVASGSEVALVLKSGKGPRRELFEPGVV
jgi:hypothetical protein